MGKQRPVLSGLMAVIGVVALYRAEVKPRMYAWGARDEDVAAPLPCDELIRADGPRTTRAVTIDAPVESVWPWIAQIGEDRAGFYSYSWLERAAGAMIHNANVIHPEWQDLRVGDTVWLARRYGEAARQVVVAVKPNSHLVLMSPDDFERVLARREGIGSVGLLPSPGKRVDVAVGARQRWRRRARRLRHSPLRDGAEDDARHARPRAGSISEAGQG